MKKIFRKFIVSWLALSAKILLLRKKPEVIAITGSAGKTTTKDILVLLLSQEFEVFSPTEGYNTELGAPLGLFAQKVPKNVSSVFAWLVVAIKCSFRSFTIRGFPKRMVVEMGADSPGDIKYLASIFKPKIGVVLSVLPVHLEEFKTVIGVAAEKSELPRALPENGTLYLNYDDKNVREMAPKTKAKVRYFGTTNTDGLKANGVKSDITGTSFDLMIEGKKNTFSTRVYGAQMIYPLLAAIAVASDEGVSLRKIKEGLKKVKPYNGRMNVIEGIRNSLIIDDSYNANPISMIAALEFLRVQSGRRIAVIGSMNELGDYEKEGHEKAGQKASESADYIFTVGEAANKHIGPIAIKNGIPGNHVKTFQSAREAGSYVKTFIKPGDVILVKGSQNKVRLEQAIEIFMAHPEKRRDILVRQSEFWQQRA